MGLRRRILETVAGIAPGFWDSRLSNPFFIVGVARSGTTLLNGLLATHTSVAALSEANDIWDPSGYPWNQSSQSSPPIWIDHEAYIQRWWQENQSRQQQIRALFGAYQTLLRAPYFLNKTPLNTYRIPYLLAMFPEARFIHLVRDGRAVVRSYTAKVYRKVQATPEAYQPYGMTDRDTVSRRLADFWQQSIQIVNNVDTAHRLTARNRLLEIAYEDLCKDKLAILNDICTFIGLKPGKFTPDVTAIKAVNQNYKWREAFSDEMAADITERMRAALQTKGYLTNEISKK